MDKLLKAVKDAAADLKLVATNLHFPLDTSTLDRAVDALAAEFKDAPKPEKPVEKFSKPVEKPVV